MKIALLGYGRMGKAIEEIAKSRGHVIVAKIDKDNPNDSISDADVAINFSVPSAAVDNITNTLQIRYLRIYDKAISGSDISNLYANRDVKRNFYHQIGGENFTKYFIYINEL